MPEETMHTPADLAKRLSVSTRTARRLMAATPGVLILGEGERRYYRMPENIFQALVNRKAVKAKHKKGAN